MRPHACTQPSAECMHTSFSRMHAHSLRAHASTQPSLLAKTTELTLHVRQESWYFFQDALHLACLHSPRRLSTVTSEECSVLSRCVLSCPPALCSLLSHFRLSFVTHLLLPLLTLVTFREDYYLCISSSFVGGSLLSSRLLCCGLVCCCLGLCLRFFFCFCRCLCLSCRLCNAPISESSIRLTYSVFAGIGNLHCESSK
jgi:hypothetical protein